MPATTLALTIETPELDGSVSWNDFEALAVQMSRDVPAQGLAEALDEAQQRLIDQVCGPRWAPVRGLPAPFACPGCGVREDFARKGKRTRPRTLHTAAGQVQLILWHVGCRGCGKNFAPLLLMLGLSGKRRTDRLTVDLAELGVQMSYARAARVDRDLAGTSATAGQAHNALADVAALLTGAGGPGDGPTGRASGDLAEAPEVPAALGPGRRAPDVVLLDGTGVRAGRSKNGVGANLAVGLTGRSGPAGRRRARVHLLGLTVGEDWSMLLAQLEQLPPPALVVVDGEAAITALAQRLWPTAPIQRCWWHLPHGLRKAFSTGDDDDDAASRHVNPRWARDRASELGELLHEQLRREHTPAQALQAYHAFTPRVPASLLSAHAYLGAAREHTFTCLDPALRTRLARLGGPELGTGVLERFMREINARTNIGGVRWSIPGPRDLLTVLAARALHHPSWQAVKLSTHRPNTIPFRLHKFNEA